VDSILRACSQKEDLHGPQFTKRGTAVWKHVELQSAAQVFRSSRSAEAGAISGQERHEERGPRSQLPPNDLEAGHGDEAPARRYVVSQSEVMVK
jgi:hypothetical protein